MNVSARARYEADLDRVSRMLADEEFVAAKVRASGAASQQVDVVGSADEAFTVTTRRQVPTTGIPAQFRSLVGSTLEVRQVEAWEPAVGGRRAGTVAVEVVGAPVRATGTLELTQQDDGTVTLRVDGEVKASLPLFGAAVEEATVGALQTALAAEERVAAAWLAR